MSRVFLLIQSLIISLFLSPLMKFPLKMSTILTEDKKEDLDPYQSGMLKGNHRTAEHDDVIRNCKALETPKGMIAT